MRVSTRWASSIVVTCFVGATLLVLATGPGSASSAAPRSYKVTFTELGLPANATWYVNITKGSSLSTTGATSTLSARLANGTYNFSVATNDKTRAPAYSPSFTVSGAASKVDVAFNVAMFTVTFYETGLYPGWSWSMVVNGTTTLSNETSASLALPDGTYNFSVSAADYAASPASGSITVNGSNTSLNISFAGSGYIGEVAGQPSFDVPIGENETLPWTVLNYGAPVNFSVQEGTITQLPDTTTPTLTVTPSSWTMVHATSYTVNVTLYMPNDSRDAGKSWPSVIIGAQATPWGFVCTSGACVLSGVAKIVSIAAIPLASYPVTFNETGLAPGTNWNISINGSALMSNVSSVNFTLGNGGVYPYSIGAVAGYTLNPTNGSVTVDGSAVTVLVNFTSISNPYSLTFSETGLPSGQEWSVGVSDVGTLSTLTKKLGFTVPNGTFNYSIAPIGGYHIKMGSYTGSVTVNGTTPPVVNTRWTQFTYPVRFTEKGLPSDTSWSVTLTPSSGPAISLNSTTESIVFREPNGTYTFTISPNSGYHISRGSYTGSITVNGVYQDRIPVSWAKNGYTVKFTEKGLALYAVWSVTMDGKTRTTDGTGISFYLPNGTYSFTINATGYSESSNPTSPLTVNGATVKVAVRFT
jgi:hypothetical protein